MRYDVGILGAGPGGYVAAIRMAQLGMKVAVIEERKLGGVCLNWGCVPTKALYSATKLMQQAGSASSMGISYGSPRLNLESLANWKDGVVTRMVEGVYKLFQANKVELITARGTICTRNAIELSTGKRIEAERIVIATGSHPINIPGFGFDHPMVWSSDEALALSEIPKKLAIVGGGVIGLEIATIYNRLGSEVTILEMAPEILPGIDLDRRTLVTLKRALKSQDIAIQADSPAQSIEDTKGGVVIHTKDNRAIEADRVLLVVGRKPNSQGIGLEKAGLKTDSQGFIVVDDNLQTTIPGVYAIGDVIAGPMLAHRAFNDALGLADYLAGNTDRVQGRQRVIPQAIFTDPEIASVGLSEARGKREMGEVLVGRFPYGALAKAVGMNEPEGFLQVVAEASSHRLIGAQIIGVEASSLIGEATIAIENGLSLEAIADSVHAHPTLPEGLKEAAQAALGRAIHTANK
jgi:dihydrolipoamide dehydrogenase